MILQSVAAQYGVLPAAQREMPWPDWLVLVAGLMEQTPLGRLVALRTQQDPQAVRRMSPWQKQARVRWRRFLTGRTAAHSAVARRQQREMQQELARMFGSR